MKNSVLAGIVVGVIVFIAVLSHVFRMPSEEKVNLPGLDRPAATASAAPSVQPLQGRSSQFVGKDKEGKTAWVLHAKTISLKDLEKKLEAQDVECTFYGDKQEPVAQVWCDGVSMNTASQNMQFNGPVRARSPKGETLYVRVLRYDGPKKKFFGFGEVKLTRGTSVLTGDKISADPNLKIVTVTGNVQVVLRSLATTMPSGSPFPTITIPIGATAPSASPFPSASGPTTGPKP